MFFYNMAVANVTGQLVATTFFKFVLNGVYTFYKANVKSFAFYKLKMKFEM